ncbi:MAG TPA: OmpA family protein [Candidatus Sulfotelmatobacter sp.]|nr:OmpA family protein [Candidatus Sulfotelmatobacter sp.]
MRHWALVLGLSLLFSLTSAFAQAQDAEGCKDSSLIQRMPGSTIATCDHKEFDSVEMPVGKNADGDSVTKNIEGEMSNWSFNNREGLSDVQVYRNFLNALQTAKWTIDFQSPNGQITAHKGSDYVFMDNMNAGFYYQTVVHLKEMQQEVVADAATLDNEIKQSGHVAVYGIHFNTGKADILPDSEGTLKEIVKLLQQDAALQLRVEGHTDNQGAAAANQALSEKRAQSVVAWLTAHGVSAARLTAKGFGQTKPVADNSTEDGRAKNRRVELAKP